MNRKGLLAATALKNTSVMAATALNRKALLAAIVLKRKKCWGQLRSMNIRNVSNSAE